jgi:chromosome segregation ATPase
MGKLPLKNISIVFLLSITAFSVFRYISSVKEKCDLLNSLNQTKEQAANLEKEKQNLLQEIGNENKLKQKLSQENSYLKERVETKDDEILELNSDLTRAGKDAEQLNALVSSLRADIAALKGEKEKLGAELTRVIREREDFTANLSFIAGQGKTVKEPKKQVHKASVETKKKAYIKEIAQGNRGFLIKDGASSHPAKVRIEVIPASPEGVPAATSKQ